MTATKFTLFTFPGSQWAQVAHLTLAMKKAPSTDYDVQTIDLLSAENFKREYLAINPQGTVPSLVSPALSSPIAQSRGILRYLDTIYVDGDPLTLEENDPGNAIIDLVHSQCLDTNLILLRARNEGELAAKKESMWNSFIINRQNALKREILSDPQHPFYRPKLAENSNLYEIYTGASGEDRQTFFNQTHSAYHLFADSMRELDRLLQLPYAAGAKVTEADFHVIPWLAHAMWGAGTEPRDVHNLEVLEDLIRKSDDTFRVGRRLQEWWMNVSILGAFKEVYPMLH